MIIQQIYPDKFFIRQNEIHKNPKLKKELMAYYTPMPVVDFINRSVLNFIDKEKQYKVLDPAMGTGIFLDNFIRKTRWDSDSYYGFELDYESYIQATLNISSANLFNINTLTEEASDLFKGDNIIIIGNPPYNNVSNNKSKFISDLIDDYKIIDGKPLGEKNCKSLQDDYVKFIRFAQHKADNASEAIIGMITNHGFIDNPTFRGMRASLLKTFNQIYIVNLHGNAKKKEVCPDGSKDENVFSIQQGTCITFFIKNNNDNNVYYQDLYGLRKDKFKWLIDNEIKT